MNFFINNRNSLWKILGLLFILSANLFAGEVEIVQQESVEVVFGSLSSMTITIIFILTSLLGAFFIKDELEGSL